MPLSPRCAGALVLMLAACLPPAYGQVLAQAANVAALAAFPTFYADRTVVVRGHLREADGRLLLEDENGSRVLALWKRQERPEGIIEVTGQFWDLGRMNQDDPRLSGHDVAPVVKPSGQEWPRPGDVFVLAVDRFGPVQSSPVNTVRSLVLEGEHASGRLVTVAGQFRGRNLFGDLPRSPGRSRWDFVLRSSEASIWVSGIQPRGKDFELNPANRVDTDQWLEVTGIVREGQGLMWIEAKSVALAKPQATTTDAAATVAAPAPPAKPPEVLFSVPVDGETDVSPATTVRIQISRDLDLESLKSRVQVAYLNAPAGQAPPPPFNLQVDERERVLTLKFSQPLERFRTVRVQLLEGIKGTDGQPLKPWQITFTVGSSE